MFGRKWLTLHLLVLLILSIFLSACGQDETLSFGQECPEMQKIILDANRVCTIGDNEDGLEALCKAYLPYFEVEQCPSRFPRCLEGSCQSSCGPMMVDCNGVCVNPLTDNSYCGATGDCEDANAGQTCLDGTVCKQGLCQDTCPSSQVYCNGRCIDPESDKDYCGAQKDCTGYTSCLDGEVCYQSKCGQNCSGGQIFCDGRCVDPQTERAFCGASSDCIGVHAGVSCSDRQVCDKGQCRTGCSDGFVICGGVCIDHQTDLTYCGADARCTGYSSCEGDQVCEDGKCEDICKVEGEMLCDGKCIDPTSNDNYCGAKEDCKSLNRGSVCAAWSKCQDSVCVDKCPIGQIMCSNTCVSPLKDLNYCGASAPCDINPGVNCETTVSQAYDVLCANGSCSYKACKPDYFDCDADKSNGCESYPKSPKSCGSCSNDCTKLKNVSEASCTVGVCGIVKCVPGFGNCDNNVSNGCETDTNTTATHCGFCGQNCSTLPNVLNGSCDAGNCIIKECRNGYFNCDTSVNNGCESKEICLI